jgi:hypothetical protein
MMLAWTAILISSLVMTRRGGTAKDQSFLNVGSVGSNPSLNRRKQIIETVCDTLRPPDHIERSPLHRIIQTSPFTLVPLCVSAVSPQVQSVTVSRITFPLIPHRPHDNPTTIQPHMTHEETNRRLCHSPIRPSLTPRLPISRDRLRYGETSVADLSSSTRRIHTGCASSAKGVPEVRTANSPMLAPVLLSHHCSSRATCWIVWMFRTSDLAGVCCPRCVLFVHCLPLG